MALYSDFVLEIRKNVQDLERSELDTFDADGATTRFVLSHDNVVNSSYIVKVSGVTKTENTHYTINKDSGEVTFTTGNVPPAANDSVTVEYRFVNIRDSEYVEMANQAIDKYEQDLWETALDDSTLSTVENGYEIDLASVSANVLFVIDAYFKVNSSASSPWVSINTVTNSKFLKDQNKLQIRPAFNVTGYPLKFWYARKFTKGTLTTDTFAPPAHFYPVYKEEIKALYLERLAFKRIHEVSVVVKEGVGYTPSDILFQQAARVRKQALEELKRIRPKRPAKTIPILINT